MSIARTPGAAGTLNRVQHETIELSDLGYVLAAMADDGTVKVDPAHRELACRHLPQGSRRSLDQNSRRTFGNGWRKLEEAVPGKMNVAPTDRLAAQLAPDYERMADTMFGEPPPFEWIVDRIR